MIFDKSGKSTEKILGYSRLDLMAHIEKQFTKGMNWEKLMLGEIHIDHIIPVSAFAVTSVESDGFSACWALSNLRPLWAAENLSKSDKRTHLI